ncbi:YciI family protein [Flavobacterium sp. '19STA2R22 D10 B1']|uniref:YciI family protein n=1 Tax=Flavobacterium aerium TaxID=3037261 RepID=UPI00278BEAF7|nr:YciI family protein [Flavobacterium sp. '19STA2R22 D10 B1']
MKEFLMLIRENTDYGTMTPEEMQVDIEKHMEWVEQLVNNGNFKNGNPLDAMGTHITGKNKIVTDGPYIESKECVSGYYILLAQSLQEATALAKGCPSLNSGGSVEIREIIDPEDEFSA